MTATKGGLAAQDDLQVEMRSNPMHHAAHALSISEPPAVVDSVWEEHLHEESGRHYYHKKETNETIWVKPERFVGKGRKKGNRKKSLTRISVSMLVCLVACACGEGMWAMAMESERATAEGIPSLSDVDTRMAEKNHLLEEVVNLKHERDAMRLQLERWEGNGKAKVDSLSRDLVEDNDKRKREKDAMRLECNTKMMGLWCRSCNSGSYAVSVAAMFAFIFGSLATVAVLCHIIILRPLKQEVPPDAIEELVHDALFYCDLHLAQDPIVKNILMEHVDELKKKAKERHPQTIFAFRTLDKILNRLENSNTKSFNLTSVSTRWPHMHFYCPLFH